jgi:hypothetical protein
MGAQGHLSGRLKPQTGQVFICHVDTWGHWSFCVSLVIPEGHDYVHSGVGNSLLGDTGGVC